MVDGCEVCTYRSAQYVRRPFFWLQVLLGTIQVCSTLDRLDLCTMTRLEFHFPSGKQMLGASCQR